MRNTRIRMVFVALLVCATGHVEAQTVRGRLLEGGSERPIPAGLVLLLSDGIEVDRAETDSAGRFTLRSPQPGSFLVRAERIGYRPKTDGILQLEKNGEIVVTFYLMPDPVELEGLDATVEPPLGMRVRRRLEAQGFYHRREYLVGQFIPPEEIAAEQPMDMMQLFQGEPGVRVSESFQGGEVCFYGRGGCCNPVLYLNGTRILDFASVRVEDISAVEIYRGAARVPLEYAGFGSGCGVLLLWTR